MLFMIRLYVSDDRSSEKPFLAPLFSMTISTTWDMMSLTSSFSASPPKMKLFPSTEEIDSLYFSVTTLSEALTSLHFFNTFCFFVVDPKFESFFMSSIDHTGKHVCYAEELRRGARRFTPTSGVFHAAFWRVQSLAWRKSKTFKKNVSCSISKINNPLTVSTNIFAPSDVCVGFRLFRGLALVFSFPHTNLPTEK